ncbi:hypothetical protein THIOM_000885 [Candidatus Thiomargarita nelsonii]|uniref:Uncharacterized protein n=1 Tax=Candidatus Thiomargarita nelsonii TaxID=1003181 RepID=A0A176S5J9_9GAMM|nr:hypothetical protein THIOM_000885 [Candidatus Thiomargarita nelsonii]
MQSSSGSIRASSSIGTLAKNTLSWYVKLKRAFTCFSRNSPKPSSTRRVSSLALLEVVKTIFQPLYHLTSSIGTTAKKTFFWYVKVIRSVAALSSNSLKANNRTKNAAAATPKSAHPPDNHFIQNRLSVTLLA